MGWTLTGTSIYIAEHNNFGFPHRGVKSSARWHAMHQITGMFGQHLSVMIGVLLIHILQVCMLSVKVVGDW